jgi:predicted glycosyltransferase involved in capsule biosynthesis
MNQFTIIHTYYNERSLLEIQLERWNVYNTPIKIILIDDGSQEVPVEEVLLGVSFANNIDLSVYKVTKDIGFNSHGCRNLGAMLAETDWLLFLDIDYTIQPSDLYRLQHEALDHNTWYEINARYKGGGAPYMALNQFIIPKNLYVTAGGYDESFVPFHYGDREFLDRLENLYNKQNLEWLNLTCRRGGRKGIIDDNATIPVYDDDKMVFYTRKFDPNNIERVTSRVNFPWKKVF